MHYQNYNKKPIASFFITVVAIAFIYFSFAGFFESILNRNEYGAGGATGITYMYNRICGLICVILGLSFYYYGKPKTLALGKMMLGLMILEWIRACIDPSGDMFVNRLLSPTLWMIMYFGAAGFFMCYDKELPITKKIIVVFLIYTALFIQNVISANSIGVTSWHYIESYYLITLLPFIILLPNKIRTLIVIIIFCLLLIAGKRTGIVVYCAAILVWMLNGGNGFSGKIKTIFSFVAISIIALYVGILLFPDKFEFIIERFMDVQEDGGSGRDKIYVIIYHKIFESDGIELIFGHGYNSVAKSNLNNGLSAHNEFLEIAWDYGLLGVSLYILLLVQLFQLATRKYLPQNLRIGMKVSGVIMLFFSLTSHIVLFSTYVLNLSIFWGLVTAYISRYKNHRPIKFL